MESPQSTPAARRFRVSLRSLFLLTAVLFVVGYQQHQLRDLRQQLHQLKTDHIALEKEHEELLMNAIINAISVRVDSSPSPADSYLRFPVEVERAMMGDAFEPRRVRDVPDR